MTKEDVQSIAFKIIAHAGSAFDHFYKAIDLAKKKDFEGADIEIKIGTNDLTMAHNDQTGLMFAEANKEDIPFSIMMVHAQDHLTMAIFLQRIAKEFIDLYQREGSR